MTSTAELLDLSHRVDAVVAALGDDVASSLARDDLRDLLVITGRLLRGVEAIAVLAADEVAERSTYDGDRRFDRAIGCRDTIDALETTTGVSSRTARSWLRAARMLCPSTSLTGATIAAVLPALRERFLTGDLALDALFGVEKPLLAARERAEADEFRMAEQAVADAVLNDPCAGQYAFADEIMVRPARADELRVHAEAWAARIDPDGAEPDAEVVAARRTLTVGRQRDGLVPVTARLLPEVAGQLSLLLAAVTNPKNSPEGVRFAPSWEIVPARPTSAQHRHDAFMTILTAAARTPDLPTLGGAAPTLVVRVDASALAEGEGSAEIDGGFSAPIAVAQHLSCGAAIERVSMRDGRIEALMTHERVFNRFQRQAIAARDRVCVMLGCEVPAMWCEIHHVTPWAARKVTTVDDGVLLCWSHHRFLETSGWEIRMNSGVPEIRPPAWMDPLRRWRAARARWAQRPPRASQASTSATERGIPAVRLTAPAAVMTRLSSMRTPMPR